MTNFTVPDCLPAGSLIGRRAWMARSAAGLGLSLMGQMAVAPADVPADVTAIASQRGQSDAEALRLFKRELIRELLYSREDLNAWLAAKAFPFCKYDPELGYLHIDRQFKEGLDGAICTYRYDASGARHTSAWAERPCRINTYGNSFTSCEQVSDHETWQEVLASHLGEPIRNFGIGGYSVYQAYLRMRREEQRLPARYIIFNIFDDDHSRNLHGWQRPRFRVNRKSPNPPVPHVIVDPEMGTFVERPNPCPTRESLFHLCDLETAYAVYGNDAGVIQIASRKAARAQQLANVAGNDFDDLEWMRRALYATTRVVELVDRFAAQGDRQVLYVLSYGAERIRRFVQEGKRFDASLVEFLDRRGVPYVDLLQAHARDAGKSSAGIDAYLARHFIGHYNPLGNFFCAFAIKDKLTKMLKPASPAYTASNANDP